MLHSYTNLVAPLAACYGIVSALSPSLLIVRMRRVGSAASLSRGYIAISVGSYLIWFVYGLCLHNVPLIVCDAIGAGMQALVLASAYRLTANGRSSVAQHHPGVRPHCDVRDA